MSTLSEVGMKKNLRVSAAYETLSDPQKKRVYMTMEDNFPTVMAGESQPIYLVNFFFLGIRVINLGLTFNNNLNINDSSMYKINVSLTDIHSIKKNLKIHIKKLVLIVNTCSVCNGFWYATD
jgi:DnaJ-class molecular chaperone